jgi:hypothetical protein
MTSDAPFTPEEIAELRTLLEVEKIRKLRNLYSQLMDLQDIDGLANLLTEDAVCEFGPHGTWHRRDAIRASWHNWFNNAAATGKGLPYGGFHMTTNLWIELTGPDSAISRSYLQSVYHEPDPRVSPIGLFGMYDEDYRKIAGAWKISHCRFHILWPKRDTRDGFPRTMPRSAIG